MRQGVRFLIPALALAFAAGCGNGALEVTGSVTWQGKPLPEGHIVFLAQDGQTTPAAGKVSDGQFSFRSTPGKKRVEISANREKPGQTNKVMGMREREQYLPPKYNANSILTAEVKTDGANLFTFDLQDRP